MYALLISNRYLESFQPTLEELKSIYNYSRTYNPTTWGYLKDKNPSSEVMTNIINGRMSDFLGYDVDIGIKTNEELVNIMNKLESGKWSDLNDVRMKLGLEQLDKCSAKPEIVFCHHGLDKYVHCVDSEKFVCYYSNDRRKHNFIKSAISSIKSGCKEFEIIINKMLLVEKYSQSGIDFSFLIEKDGIFVYNQCGRITTSPYYDELIKNALRTEYALRRVEWCLLGIQRLPNHSVLVSNLSEETVDFLNKATLYGLISFKAKDRADELLLIDVRKYT